MSGIHAATAAPLTADADIRHSIGVILTTPIGTRVMRRPFGSYLFDLVDSPATERGALRLIAAAADAIERWEPRVVFDQGMVTVDGSGRATLLTRCRVRADDRPIEVPIGLGVAS
jgi:uncharacterized protein